VDAARGADRLRKYCEALQASKSHS
jgi:hypothetical protein